MKKQVLLLAVSCKTGGLCPGGIDLSNSEKWIRIVKDDGKSGAVQGHDIDFAKPLDIIEFDGRPIPQGKQKENWVIDNCSCRKIKTARYDIIHKIYKTYEYHGFWDNDKPYLTKEEFDNVTQPSESILQVRNIRIYKNSNNKAKIEFFWSGSRYKIKDVSMTDPDVFDRINNDNELYINEAYIVVSIPKDINDWINPQTGECRAYKFVSKIFEI